MAFNPAGYVCPYDGGHPDIITGVVASAYVSGGQLVYFSGAEGAISSGLNSIADGDIMIVTGASGAAFNGVAIQTAASGNSIGVATKGCVIMTAGDTVTAGTVVAAVNGDSVKTAATAGHTIGRAITAAGSEGYAIIQM